MWKCYICGEKYAMNICMGCGVRYCNDCYSNLKTEIWSGAIDISWTVVQRRICKKMWWWCIRILKPMSTILMPHFSKTGSVTSGDWHEKIVCTFIYLQNLY